MVHLLQVLARGKDTNFATGFFFFFSLVLFLMFSTLESGLKWDVLFNSFVSV